LILAVLTETRDIELLSTAFILEGVGRLSTGHTTLSGHSEGTRTTEQVQSHFVQEVFYYNFFDHC
jgi:hypothetical protein